MWDSNAFTRNAAICSFGIPSVGQKLFPPQPAVIPSTDSCPIQSPNGASGVGGHGTSSNTCVSPHGGGTYPGPCSPFRMNTAVWPRVWTASGQKLPPPHPAVYPSSKNDWM